MFAEPTPTALSRPETGLPSSDTPTAELSPMVMPISSCTSRLSASPIGTSTMTAFRAPSGQATARTTSEPGSSSDVVIRLA